jgi:hypothetical protein
MDAQCVRTGIALALRTQIAVNDTDPHLQATPPGPHYGPRATARVADLLDGAISQQPSRGGEHLGIDRADQHVLVEAHRHQDIQAHPWPHAPLEFQGAPVA